MRQRGCSRLRAVSFVAAIVVLALAGVIASAIPARRAASVDPMEALRAE